jgi:hypothetical protein
VEVGCATIRTRYDAGNLSELSCLNEQGAPTISTPGYYSTRSTYDTFGNQLTIAFYRLDGAQGLVGDTYTSIVARVTCLAELKKRRIWTPKAGQ